jgi:zinc/manganese transport system substrate-binding protein
MNARFNLMSVAVLSSVVASSPAQAEPPKVAVVTTLNALAAITREIGGDHVAVTSLAKPTQDPHTLVAKPTFKAAAKKARLFVELGLGLDAWASAVIDASGNPGIQVGQAGHVVAALGVTTVELPDTLSKAWGDIHPGGNPHVWLDPVLAKQLARNIAAGLGRVDTSRKPQYDAGLRRFEERIDEALYGRELVEEYGAGKLERLSRRGELVAYLQARGTYGKLGGWLKRGERLRGLSIVTYHKTWIYFCNRFGIQIRGEIEEKPGIPPSQEYLRGLSSRMKSDGIKVIFLDTIYPGKDGQFLARETGARIVSSPIDVGGAPGTDDYFRLIDTLVDRTLAATW